MRRNVGTPWYNPYLSISLGTSVRYHVVMVCSYEEVAMDNGANASLSI